MAKKKIPTPKADPRYEGAEGNMRRANAQRGEAGFPSEGSPMDVRDHPAHNKPDATEHHDGTALGDAFTALGPKTAYKVETSQMGQAVDISESVPRRAE